MTVRGRAADGHATFACSLFTAAEQSQAIVVVSLHQVDIDLVNFPTHPHLATGLGITCPGFITRREAKGPRGELPTVITEFYSHLLD